MIPRQIFLDDAMRRNSSEKIDKETLRAAVGGMGDEVVNMLTIDVEDYFMVSAFSDVVRFETWETMESRVERNTIKVLDILQEYGVHATFFVLGWVAEKFPSLVRAIVDAKNEIACHGYRHRLVYEMSPAEFYEDTRRAKSILEDVIGDKVLGYRAPTFSIIKENLEVLDILAEQGFAYDSSIFPVHHGRYGYPQFSRVPVVLMTGSGPILEIPPSTIRFAGQNIPFAGGGYFRFFPLWLTEWGIRKLNKREGRLAVVYLHPWEMDPGQPSIPCGNAARYRHYLNLDKTEQRLQRLLQNHRFSSIREAYGATLDDGPRIPILETRA